MRLLAALFLGISLAAADVVKEAEPNDDPERKGRQEIRPGQTLEGSFADAKDKDHFVLVSDKEQVVTFRLSHGKGSQVGSFFVKRLMPRALSGAPNTTGFQTRRLRLREGRFDVEISSWMRGTPGPYRLEIIREPDAPDLETEPNDLPAQRREMTPGAFVRAEKSHPFGDVDQYAIAVKERGIYRLTITRADVPDVEAIKKHRGRFVATVVVNAKQRYVYEVDDLDTEFRFFPVLDPGRHAMSVHVRSGVVGAGYTVRVERFSVDVGQKNEAAARKAIDRGLSWLVASPLKVHMKHDVAATATALLALGEGSGLMDRKEERAKRADELVTALEKSMEPAPGGEWAGKPVLRFGDQTYGNAFAVLALAEAAAGGSERARNVCAAGIPYLLASQISPKRSAAWGPVKPGSTELGGWRYTPDTKSGDLSVTGWCLIALYAAANADIEIPGIVEAADWSLRMLKQCSGLSGYNYQVTTGGRPSCVRQSIGALLALIFGQPSKALEHALDDLDAHLCAGTQVGHGDNAPFYYWYYATRVNYLRGGYHWEAWRAVTLEQLLRRQRADGSWAAIHQGRQGGERYSTGMAVLILRLCIGEPPHYLSRDVEGF